MNCFNVDLPERLKQKLQKGCLNKAGSIADFSDLKLKKLGFSMDEMNIVRSEAAKSFQIENGKDYRWSRISLGCIALDAATNGGISTRGVTEIFGESGVGKTQLLLQLCLMVQLPQNIGGLKKHAVYICTEDIFPSRRLYQLIDKFQQQFDSSISYAENVFVEHIIEMDELMDCVFSKLPKLLKIKNIGLIIIDSIAGVFRLQDDIVKRANTMRKLVAELRRLANKYNCAVVCSNQVTSGLTHLNESQPSLGLAWAHLITTRLKISKIYRKSELYHTNLNPVCSSLIRTMETIFSPGSSRGYAKFLISSDGIEEA
ncbi:DNA repair protein XRCC3 isoform X2 [Hermetia illucens]|uniref:DNA repair protein XRCC3 isoform X2 n=1 Tax=Hermetia illucens TaxID=343691 RepID=UPI0018CC4FC9|nr:DNA repair protein XRCC3 isoform X2 [Hermetia illucens]